MEGTGWNKSHWGAPDNWCFQTVVLEKTLENPLNYKKIQPDHPKGNQSWIFIGSTGAKAETTILWPPHVKNWLTGKDPDGWERLKAGGEGDNRGWDGWMASPTQWTWVWASSQSRWWAGKPGVLQSMASQSRIRSNWAELMSETWLSGWKQWRKFLSSPEVMGLSPHLLLTLNIMGPSFFSLWFFKISVWITSKVYRLKWSALSFCFCWELQCYHSLSASSKGHHKKLVSEARCHICLKAVAEIILHRYTTLLIVS